MNKLNQFFPGPAKLWSFLIFIFFIIVSYQNGCTCRGCGGCNGCTTSVVIEQQSRKIKVDDIRIKITANKNRVTNRKLKLDSVLFVDKTVWYSVDYNIEIENRPELKKLCEYEVPKNQDLEKSIDKFKIVFSPNKQHFAVGLDKQIYDFFHLLEKGVPFSSGCYYLNDSNYTFLRSAQLNFNTINWKKFPESEALLDKVIISNQYSAWVLPDNQSNVLELLNEMPPGNSHDMVLIENWYGEIADMHFTRERVEKIIKVSPKWKEIALLNLQKYIKNSIDDDDQNLKASLDMILWINDEKSIKTTDDMVFNKFFASGYAGDYFVSRFKDRLIPLKSKIHDQILIKARKIGSSVIDPIETFSIENVIQILLIANESNILNTFLDKNITIEELREHYSYISPVTIKLYEQYPKEAQKKMVQKYHQIVKNPQLDLFSMDISSIIEFLKDKITCKELKELVKMHKDKLIAFQWPRGCRE